MTGLNKQTCEKCKMWKRATSWRIKMWGDCLLKKPIVESKHQTQSCGAFTPKGQDDATTSSDS
jgi:hypothetical protein